ncbi:Transcription elongation factor GreB [Arenibacter antarcticus]|uniref:GreA/GreB family elongation factor n=1 Tax=Arenibacter antarcticus TaxID=2040469 RepID=A0ABW5VED3_9FLAO|nr:GreA/GreB family elongation factor [Arenibacter sp. H213]MCM4166534.1 transcription elongation factor GreA [Arenibacter sp. H213]
MSRGFVREDDQEEIPLVPPRADLPDGVTNYVTQTGMNALLDEKKELMEEIANLDSANESERRIAVNHINAKLQLLNNRISTAKIIHLHEQPKDEVRFGAMVVLRVMATNKTQKFQIVGVDEADITKGKIAFISPIAKILIEKRVGDKAVLQLANENRVFEILDISYR